MATLSSWASGTHSAPEDLLKLASCIVNRRCHGAQSVPHGVSILLVALKMD